MNIITAREHSSFLRYNGLPFKFDPTIQIEQTYTLNKPLETINFQGNHSDKNQYSK